MGRVGEVRYLERRRGAGIRTSRRDGYSNLPRHIKINDAQSRYSVLLYIQAGDFTASTDLGAER